MSAHAQDVILATEAASEAVKLPQRINEIQMAIENLKLEYAQVPDVTDKQGMVVAKVRKANLVALRNDGDRARLAFTEPLRNEIGRINTVWNDEILPQLAALENPLATAIAAEKFRIAEIKRIATEKETIRIDAIRKRLMDIGTIPGTLITVESIDEYASSLKTVDASEFAEFEQAAVISINNAQAVLAVRRETLQEQEDESARLKTERDELTRLAAQQRSEQERIEAEQNAAAQSLIAERSAIENERRELAEREAKSKREAIQLTRRMGESVKAKQREQAEAERLLALAPDKDKLLAWLDSIPPLPDTPSPEGQNAAHQLMREIEMMKEFIGKMDRAISQEAE